MSEEARAGARWVRRAPHVIGVWRSGGRHVQSAARDTAVPVTPFLLDLLDRLDDWTGEATLATALEVPLPALAVLLDGLAAHAIVELAAAGEPPPAAPRTVPSPLAGWAPAAAIFHHATRDVAFARAPQGSPAAPAGERPPAVLPPCGATSVPLPAPRVPIGLAAAMRDRRTHRQFADGPLRLEELATLLGATFGVQAWVQTDEGPLALKTSPSGGARHSLEAYVWARRVEGLPEGRYHYRPGEHRLTRLDRGRSPDRVSDWLPSQHGYDDAAVVIVLASVLARVAWRYRSARAYRVVLIEAGHLGQTFCLTAAALGLAPFCTAALADTAIEEALGLAGDHQPAVYVLGAGRRKDGGWQPHAGQPPPPLSVTALGQTLDGRLTRRWRAPRRPPRRARGR